jgi:toxin ParE1/3/4
MQLQWSPRAERELTQIRDYIAQDSQFYARQFTERLILAIERLPPTPRIGRMVPEAGHVDEIRELIFHGYRVIYRIEESQQLLQIITIVHGARDLPGITPPPWEPTDPQP